ncbi:MAG TPA: hypothetical protein PK331_03455 [Gordonia sp. (in: high G+C Gram-positive bacteria)]|uniref:hypothetical protein n=1 Tax=Gordonia sp. (in: high G+C Gram-positive bacteria) TaxID=84139 RepID=UPI000F937121|nr:hypothetical protein [Gordonia sp. (in: high G+C Gram-positive bacteria)]RUP36214.1 MAG: DUF2191 domain-containing protein [Gordonia sp. (in: high G+C Gram-positive bacteria)]HNP59159.1 hypothetical protein [Gordonia sp. (in: high G+C Gram-positive bacteria)]HRC49968.1 hypothetical protein [Gordonia sp. (in: high G+C Gram-positive bacteria)]
MKTSFDLPEDLINEVKRVADTQRRTPSALVTEGLIAVLDRCRRQEPVYRLPDASVDGDGVVPEFASVTWQELRSVAY